MNMKTIYFQIAIGTDGLNLSLSFAPFSWRWFKHIKENGFCFMFGPFVLGGMTHSKEMIDAAMKNLEA